MRSLRKFNGAMWQELPGRIWQQFCENRNWDQSAMLAFHFLLSIFPLLLFLTALLGAQLQSDPDLQKTLQHYLATVLPGSAPALIETTLAEISQGSGAFALSFTMLLMWWSASQGMLAIIRALNEVHGVSESRPWWQQYLVASTLTIAGLMLFAVVLVLLVYGSRVSENIALHFPLAAVVSGTWFVLAWVILLALVLTAFNMIYFFAPDVKHRQWRWLMPGTVAGVFIWLLASFGFKYYLTLFNSYSITYGSIGAVIVLLFWLYISGMAMLVGAEVNVAIEKAHEQAGASKE